MMIKTSYPLARIAAHYKVDYQQVLFAADYLYGRNNTSQGRSAYNCLPLVVTNWICQVRDQYRLIQSGYADWNDGHVLVL